LRQAHSSEGIDHAFEVVGHDCKTHLRLSADTFAKQEARMAEDAVLQRGEGMFDCRSSQSHERGRGSFVHTVERLFGQMAQDEALRPVGAASLERTTDAVFSPSLVVDGTVFSRELLASERLARRTDVGVCLRLVGEHGPVEQGSVSVVVDSPVSGYVWGQAGGFAAAGLFAVRVTPIGDDVDWSDGIEGRTSGLRHRLQTAVVRRFHGHLMGHDQGVLSVDGSARYRPVSPPKPCA
jgi:hypothetical protein